MLQYRHMSILFLARTPLPDDTKLLFGHICQYIQQKHISLAIIHPHNAWENSQYKSGKIFKWSSVPKSIIKIILFPLIFILEILRVGSWKLKYHTTTVVLFTLEDQLRLTLPAKLFRIKIVWHQPILPPKIVYVWWNLCSRFAISYFVSPAMIHIAPFSAKIPHLVLPIPLLSPVQQHTDTDLPHTSTQKFIIGMAGDISPESGFEYAIKAMPIIREVVPYAQLIIAGEGKEKKKLLWLIEQMGLKESIKIVSQGKQRANWMRHFTLFLFLPQNNFVSLQPLLEAMSAGCPIVASHIEIIRDIIIPSKHGILIEPQNSEMIAQAIINFANHPDWRVTMGELCRRNIIEHHSLEGYLKEFEHIVR